MPARLLPYSALIACGCADARCSALMFNLHAVCIDEQVRQASAPRGSDGAQQGELNSQQLQDSVRYLFSKLVKPVFFDKATQGGLLQFFCAKTVRRAA